MHLVAPANAALIRRFLQTSALSEHLPQQLFSALGKEPCLGHAPPATHRNQVRGTNDGGFIFSPYCELLPTGGSH